MRIELKKEKGSSELKLLATKPLDEITEQEAGDVVRDVFNRHSEEAPVGVARFSSAI